MLKLLYRVSNNAPTKKVASNLLQGSSNRLKLVFKRPIDKVFDRSFTTVLASNSLLEAKTEDSEEDGRPALLISHTYQGHDLSALNRKLDKVKTSDQAYEICREIKELKLQPDIYTYHFLLKAIQSSRDFNLGLVYLKDMIAQGIVPNVSTFNLMLELSVRNGAYVEYLTELASAMGIQFNGLSREIILRGMLQRGDYVMLLSTWEKWQCDSKIVATLLPSTLQLVITAYASSGQAKTALELLQDPGSRAISAPTPEWLMRLLRNFIRIHYADGAFYLLNKLMSTKVFPDEGACIEGLNLAARSGHSKLASQLVQALGALKIELSEWHFVPIIQAYLKGTIEHEWRRGIHVACVMEEAGVPINTRFLSPPLIDHFSEHPQLARGLELTLKETRFPHTTLWNILIQSYVRTGTMEAATALFDYICDAASDGTIPRLVPNSLTFDIMLQGAASAGLKKLASKVEHRMSDFDAPLTLNSYTSLINLALSEEEDYDAAFLYLETMKSNDIIPTRDIYLSIISRCAKERDPRAYVAVQDMESFGYKAGSFVSRLIETGGASLPVINLPHNKLQSGESSGQRDSHPI